MRKRRNWSGYLYILPALVVVGVFTVYPLVRVFLMSTYEGYDFASGTVKGYGPENFRSLMQDEVFHQALLHTFLYVLVVTPVVVALALLLAVLLNSSIRLRGLFQTVYFLPYVTSVVAMGIVWSWLFHSEYGLVNYVLGLFGAAPVHWLNDPAMAMPTLILFSIWKGLAFNIVIFLAGLQNIDPQYYQAARIDATPKRRVFFRITVPLLSPMIAYAVVMEMINSFKVYTEVYALFGGDAGPANSAVTVVYYIYDQFYGNRNFGVASAAAVVLFAVILAFTLAELRISRRRVFFR